MLAVLIMVSGCGHVTQQTVQPNLQGKRWSYAHRTDTGLNWRGEFSETHFSVGVESEEDTELTWQRNPVSVAVVTQDAAGETWTWVVANHRVYTISLMRGVAWQYQQSMVWQGTPVAVVLAYFHHDQMVELKIPVTRVK